MSHPALAAATPLWVGLAWLLTTVALYMAAKRLFLRHPRIWLSPILVTPTVLLALVLLTGTTYEAYWSQSRWLTWLLGPATVAFALPIYQQRHVIARYPLTLAAGVATGVVVGVGSSWLLSLWLDLPRDIMLTLLPRSVSSPFAMPAAQALGGQPELAVLAVLVTGVFGMLVGQGWLWWAGIRHPVSEGAAFGAGAHGVGTAKAWQMGPQQGAISSLVMIFSGIVLVLLTPLLARLVA
jgi:putative effector of murein hydrolase